MSLEAKVGVFVIASVLVLGATVYSVRTTQDVRGQVVYTTYLRHAGGIAQGTPVLFAGIRVGQVMSVGPSPADPTRIEVTFAVKADTPVNAASVARVGSVTLMSRTILAFFLPHGFVLTARGVAVVPSSRLAAMSERANRAQRLRSRALRGIDQMSGIEAVKLAPSILVKTAPDGGAREHAPMSIDLGSCRAPETIVVKTSGSVYELLVLQGDEGDVLVRGGSHFPEFCRVLFVGSSTPDGDWLDSRTIDVGLRMQFVHGNRLVVTSVVQSLSRCPVSLSTRCVTAE
jgi:hypothetical protein